MSKLFSITSMYSLAAQENIQATHADDELCLKVIQKELNLQENINYTDWITNFKTRVSLKVHSPKDVEKLSLFLEENKYELNIPFASFREPEMNDSMTAISLVAPLELCHPLQKEVNHLFVILADISETRIFSFMDYKKNESIFEDALMNTDLSTKYVNIVAKKDQNMDTLFFFSFHDSKSDNEFKTVALNYAQLEFYRTVRQYRLA